MLRKYRLGLSLPCSKACDRICLSWFPRSLGFFNLGSCQHISCLTASWRRQQLASVCPGCYKVLCSLILAFKYMQCEENGLFNCLMFRSLYRTMCAFYRDLGKHQREERHHSSHPEAAPAASLQFPPPFVMNIQFSFTFSSYDPDTCNTKLHSSASNSLAPFLLCQILQFVLCNWPLGSFLVLRRYMA